MSEIPVQRAVAAVDDARGRAQLPRASSSELAGGAGSARWSRRTATGTARSSARGRRWPEARAGSRWPRPREAAELRAPPPGCPRILTMGALTPASSTSRSGADSDVGGVAAGLRRAGRRARDASSGCGRASTSSTTPGMGRLGERDPDAVLDARRSGGGRRAARAGRALDPLRHRRRARTRRSSTSSSSASAPWPSACAPSHPGRPRPRRQQRRDLARPGLALRHGPLRDRDLRPRPVPGGPRRARASSRRSSCAPTSPTSSASRPGRAPATAGAGGRPSDTWVGVLPIGYGDGVRRGLTNNAEVLVGGAPIPARRHGLDGQRDDRPRARDRRRAGRPAVLIGAQGDERILCEEVARRLETINYEITCGISARVPRVHVAPRRRERVDRRSARRGAGGPRLPRGAGRRGRCLDRRRRDSRRGARAGGRRTSTSRSRGDEREAARAIAAGAGGHAFQLSEEFATWRVARPRTAPGTSTSAGLRGDGDRGRPGAPRLHGQRDRGPARRSPAPSRSTRTGGLADLEARVLRAVSERSFADDPLRILRAARIAAGLGARDRPRDRRARPRGRPSSAGEPAGERQFAELRLLLTGADPLRGLALLDELGATGAVLPELEALRGVEQNPYHHLDVHGHTLEVLGRLLAVEADLDGVRRASARTRSAGSSPSRSPTSSPAAARCASPPSSTTSASRRPARGARAGGCCSSATTAPARGSSASSVGGCGRAAGSRDYLANLTLNHLRLGFLVHERPLSRRHVYEYLRATEPDSVDVTLLTVADRLATQGERTRQEAIDAHLELAREMIGEALDWRRDGPPRSPIRGDELAAELGIEPGPELGRLLGEIEAAVFAGEVATRDEAIALARRLAEALSPARNRLGCPIGGRATASSAGSSPATCRRRSSTPTSTRSPSWTSTRRRRGTRWSCRGTHTADLMEISDEDLSGPTLAARRLAQADEGGARARRASTSSTPAGRPPGRRSSTSTST